MTLLLFFVKSDKPDFNFMYSRKDIAMAGIVFLPVTSDV
jgi:hypothetical protein